jgi:hypothetical protein
MNNLKQECVGVPNVQPELKYDETNKHGVATMCLQDLNIRNVRIMVADFIVA